MRVVCGGERQPDAGASKSLLHHLGLEIHGIVRMYLQWMAKPSIQHLQGAQYLLAGSVAERDGLEPLAEDILQSEQVLVPFGHVAVPEYPCSKLGKGLPSGRYNNTHPSASGLSGPSLDMDGSAGSPGGSQD